MFYLLLIGYNICDMNKDIWNKIESIYDQVIKIDTDSRENFVKNKSN